MPLKDRRKRVSASPLIDPDVCGLVWLAPDRQAYASLREPLRKRVARDLSALTAAARIMDVPVFVAWPGDKVSNAIRNCPLCAMKNCPHRWVHDRGWGWVPPVTGRREAEPTGGPSPAGGALISPLLRLARSR